MDEPREEKMKLIDKITVKRPETCDSCPFGSDDADEGAMCCGHRRDDYMYKDSKGRNMFSRVESPQEALEHDCDCMFVEET